MLKTIALVGFAAALALPPVVAFGQTGYGVVPGQPSATTFDRRWNASHLSKDRRGPALLTSAIMPGWATIIITITTGDIPGRASVVRGAGVCVR
jgi:hypothetical protein